MGKENIFILNRKMIREKEKEFFIIIDIFDSEWKNIKKEGNDCFL